MTMNSAGKPQGHALRCADPPGIRRAVGERLPVAVADLAVERAGLHVKARALARGTGSSSPHPGRRRCRALHCSQRRYWQPEFDGSVLNLAGWAKRLTHKPAIAVGSVGLAGELNTRGAGGLSQPAAVAGIEALLERLERDEFDLIAVGRALLADPAWARKVRERRFDELIAYSPAALERLH